MFNHRLRSAVMLVLLASFAKSQEGSGHSASYDNQFPQWSPDNQRIAFLSSRDGDPEIYTMAANGSDARRLTTSPGRDAHPYFLPSGDRVVFQSPRDHSNEREVDLYVMDKDGKNQRRLITAPGFNGVPVPSRSGKWIAYQRGAWDEKAQKLHWELHLVDQNGKSEKQLTSNAWSSQVPSWFPGDRELVFFADPGGRDQLFVLDVASSAVRPLLKTSANDRTPSVSPDGRHVAFTSDREGGDAADLYVLDLHSNATTRLTNGMKLRSQPSWSSDGKRLLFSGGATGVDEVYVVGTDGTGPTRLTFGTEGTK